MLLVVVAGMQYLGESVFVSIGRSRMTERKRKRGLTCGPPALCFLGSFMIGIRAFHGIGMRGLSLRHC